MAPTARSSRGGRRLRGDELAIEPASSRFNPPRVSQKLDNAKFCFLSLTKEQLLPQYWSKVGQVSSTILVVLRIGDWVDNRRTY